MADEQVKDPATEDDGKITVEVVGEKNKPELTDEEVAKLADQAPADDEIARYSKDAQRRIKSLHIAGQEWRRRAAQSSRDVATATSLAEQLYRENQELKSNMGRNEAALIEQAILRATAQLNQAKDRAKAAHTAGDADAIVTANEEVARSVAEVDRLRLLKPTAERVAGAAPSAGETGTVGPPVASPPPGGAPQPRPLSEGVKKWVEKNPWFGKPGEEEITGFALGVHQSLEKQGITEEANPEEYWNTINRRLKEVYPDRFTQKSAAAAAEPAAPKRPVTVTGGTRVNGDERAHSARRHVVLTESQVRIARNLGLTPEQYAAQLVKDEQKRDREEGRAIVQ